MSKRKKIAIGIVVLIMISLGGLYVYLGGLNTIEVSIQNVQGPYRIVGVDFEGRPTDKRVREYFFDMRERIQKGELKGRLSMTYFRDAETKRNEVKLFLGVILDEIPSEIPDEFRMMGVEVNEVVEARLEVHNIVMPSPASIEERMIAFAQNAGYSYEPISIEIYSPDNTVRVHIPLKR